MLDLRPPLPAVPGRLQRLAPLAVAAAAATAVAVVAVVDPNEAGHYPTCPLLAATGLFCPGCGALRALHALTRADVGLALDRNPLTVLAVPYLVWAWFAWTARVRGRRRSRRALPAAALWVLLGAVLAFGVLRNVPAFAWLAP